MKYEYPPVILMVGLVLTGCMIPNGSTDGDSSNSDISETLNNRSPTPETQSPHHTAESTDDLTVEPNNRLVLQASGNISVTITQYMSEEKQNMTNRLNYTISDSETKRVDEFVPDGWIVLSMDGYEIWSEYVDSADHIELRVDSSGNITVVRRVLV